METSPDTNSVTLIAGLPVVFPWVAAQLVPELRARVFTVNIVYRESPEWRKMEALQAMTGCRDVLSTLPAGGDWRKISKAMVALLLPFFRHKEAAVLTADALRERWSFIASGLRDWRQSVHCHWAFPYWKYVDAGDAHSTPLEAVLAGKIFAWNSGVWDVVYPPWCCGCRGMVVHVGHDEANRIAAREMGLRPEHKTLVDESCLRFDAHGFSLFGAPRWKCFGDAFGEAGWFRFSRQQGWAAWNPREWDLSFEQIRSRYDGREAEFETCTDAAAETLLDSGVTLLDWWKAGK